jgi:hypothetical protein
MTSTPPAPSNAVLERLRGEQPLYAVELRPPKSDLPAERSMDTWIDMYHSVRRLAQHDTLIFLTDNAVGEAEEENLRHLVTNLAGDVSTSALVPFLTCKHALEYCTMYADRAVGYGFPALTVLGGDRTVGPPRCVEYAYLLRQHLRVRHPHLLLGGWANPHADPVQQVDYLAREAFTAEFYLTQSKGGLLRHRFSPGQSAQPFSPPSALYVGSPVAAPVQPGMCHDHPGTSGPRRYESVREQSRLLTARGTLPPAAGRAQ